MVIEIFLVLHFVTFLIFAKPPAEDTLYVARILVTRPKAEFPQQLCSGSLMLKAWVLTSAFCVRNAWERDVQIYFGNSPAKLIRNVESIHEHEQFNPTSHVNDIALLKLATPLLETNPIPMPIYNRDKLLMQNDFIMPDVIREAKFLSWRGRTMRERKLESIPHQLNQKPCVNMKYNQFICSESLDFRLNDEPPRKGDWGGPLLIRVKYGNEEKYFQFGVLSFTLRAVIRDSIDDIDFDPEQPPSKITHYNVYTYVFYHFDWIQAIIRNNTLSSEMDATFEGIGHSSPRSVTGDPFQLAIEDEFGRRGIESDWSQTYKSYRGLEKVLSIEKASTESPYKIDESLYDAFEEDYGVAVTTKHDFLSLLDEDETDFTDVGQE